MVSYNPIIIKWIQLNSKSHKTRSNDQCEYQTNLNNYIKCVNQNHDAYLLVLFSEQIVDASN